MKSHWHTIMAVLGFTTLVISAILLSDTSHQLGPTAVGLTGQQPQLTTAPDGSVYLVYGSENNIYCSVSMDGGDHFAPPVIVANEGPLALGRHRGPRIAATQDVVVITAEVGKLGKGQDGSLMAWTSKDRGKTWSKSTTINDAANSAREGLHCMAAGPHNLVFAAWLDLRNLVPGNPGTELYGSVSSDGGITWSRNMRVYQSPDGTICQCCHPSAAVDASGRILVMWRNALAGSRDLYWTASTDGGKTFSAGKKLGMGTWLLSACPMDGGDITVARDGVAETIWRRQDQIFFSGPSGAEELVGSGKNPAIIHGASGRYLAWEDSAKNCVVLLKPGAKAPIPLGTNSTYVDLVAGPGGKIIAAWEENENGKKSIKTLSLS
jgi:hypothetical protein